MELMNQICGSLHEVYGATKKPIKSYTNQDGTEIKIYNLMEQTTKKQTQECPMCEGTGKSDLTACCGASYDSDYMICTDCHEHLGDEDTDCMDCNGKGIIDSPSVDSFAEHEALEAIRREGLFSNELTEDDFIQDI